MQKTTSLLLASFVTIILSIASVSSASAIEVKQLHLSSSQQSILRKAYQIAEDDGFKDPTLFQGIIYLESHAETPRTIPGHKRSCCYGVSQLQLRTAQVILKKFPWLAEKALSKNELKEKLKKDPIFAMKIASKYLLSFGTKISPLTAVVAYNTGSAKANPYKNKYALQVLNNSRLIKKALKEDVS